MHPRGPRDISHRGVCRQNPTRNHARSVQSTGGIFLSAGTIAALDNCTFIRCTSTASVRCVPVMCVLFVCGAPLPRDAAYVPPPSLMSAAPAWLPPRLRITPSLLMGAYVGWGVPPAIWSKFFSCHFSCGDQLHVPLIASNRRWRCGQHTRLRRRHVSRLHLRGGQRRLRWRFPTLRHGIAPRTRWPRRIVPREARWCARQLRGERNL